MNYDDEDYVRLYTRDTVTWKMLGWQGQTVLLHLLKGRFDRAGVFVTDRHAASRAVTAATDLPIEVVEVGLAKLLDEGVLVEGDGCLVWPNFVEAQTAVRSDKARKRDERARRAAAAASEKRASRENTARDNGSRNVTGSHVESRDVTKCHPSRSDPIRSEPSRAEDPPYPPNGGHTVEGTPPARDPMARIWSPPEQRPDVLEVWDAWRTEFDKLGAQLDHKRAEAIAARLDEGATLEEFRTAFRGARLDDWLASKGYQLGLMLGDRERFEHLVDLGSGRVKPPEPKRCGTGPGGIFPEGILIED